MEARRRKWDATKKNGDGIKDQESEAVIA